MFQRSRFGESKRATKLANSEEEAREDTGLGRDDGEGRVKEVKEGEGDGM